MSTRNPFTLIELLIVISIIAVIAAMLLPTLKRARDAAYRIRCTSNMKQVGIGIVGYVNDHKDWMPGDAGNGIFHHNIIQYLGIKPAAWGNSGENGWYSLMAAYRENSVLVCPSAVKIIQRTWKASEGEPGKLYYSNYRPSYYSSSVDSYYCGNFNEYSWIAEGYEAGKPAYQRRFRKMNKIRGNVLCAEKPYRSFPGATSGWSYTVYDKSGTGTTRVNDTNFFHWTDTMFVSYNYYGPNSYYGAGTIHDNTGNWLMLDGSVRVMKWRLHLLTANVFYGTEYYTIK